MAQRGAAGSDLSIARAEFGWRAADRGLWSDKRGPLRADVESSGASGGATSAARYRGEGRAHGKSDGRGKEKDT